MKIADSETIFVNKKRRNRGWLLGGLLGLMVLAMIIAAIFLVITQDDEKLVDKKPTSSSNSVKQKVQSLRLEDYVGGYFTPSEFNATWISDNELLYSDVNNNVLIYNVETDTKQEILHSSSEAMKTAFEITLSPDRQFLLIGNSQRKVFRNSYTAQYSLVNLNTKNVTKLMGINGNAKLRFAFWGPVGNSLVFVTDNNIFYLENAEDNEVKMITTDGSVGNIYNGITDWVYEEEIFSSNRAVWFSPDGKKLAYAKFNDTEVTKISLPNYGTPGNLRFQYPGSLNLRYPKTGTKNPVATLHVVDLEEDATYSLETPSSFGSEAILATVSWANDKKLSAIWMNRIQNEGEIISYDIAKNGTLEVIKKVDEPNGWLELFRPPIFSKNGEQMLLIMPIPQNNVGDFMHLTVLENKEDGVTKALTMGGYTVTKILSWDEKDNLIYYTATTEETPTKQHVYSVSTETNEIKCVSCRARNTMWNSRCTHSTAYFSKDYTHYVLSCNGPEVPEVSVYSSAKSKLFTWHDNKEIGKVMEGKHVPVIKRMTFEVEGGFKAVAQIRYPPNIDMSGKTKYPMLVDVYAGPNTHKVNERFNLDWGSYLTVNKSIIYVSIDGRGSSLKGNSMAFTIYKKFGTVEVADQISVTRQIQEALPFTDPNRTAIWGWSYGGYVSAMALASSNTFKCGISVAPVSDWVLYDTMYTERYMGLPQDNLDAYIKARLFDHVEGIRGKKYLLIHGTRDDNVHYQQSRLWAKILQKNDILFSEQSYTDEDHNLSAVYPHLYHSLENFLDDCFGVSKK